MKDHLEYNVQNVKYIIYRLIFSKYNPQRIRDNQLDLPTSVNRNMIFRPKAKYWDQKGHSVLEKRREENEEGKEDSGRTEESGAEGRGKEEEAARGAETTGGGETVKFVRKSDNTVIKSQLREA